MVSLLMRWSLPSISSMHYRLILSRPIHFSPPCYAEEKVKATKTVFLPSTTFTNHVKSTERARLDQEISERGELNSLYEWQLNERKNTGTKTFELLDGPPYANGSAHTGHAINKILKDFIVKSCMIRGERVIFRPGWDCHGLPIELKITKNTQGKDPIQIREMAREVAMNSVADQMKSFKRWGITADWSNPYLTLSPSYVSCQLRSFAQLIRKGLVYRDRKPVYWSPSSGTALAESELEYKEDHKSTALFYRFKVINLPLSSLSLSSSESSKPYIIYALIWTTTPWTLPLNNAISIDSNEEYSLIQFDDETKNPINELYIVASALIDSLKSCISNRPFTVVGSVRGCDLDGKFYRGCWTSDVALPIVSSTHVSMSIGTGCVHTSYAHGFDDYQVAKRRGDRVEVFVDERGRYTRDMGHDLEGKSVLGDGMKKVMELLKKDIVWKNNYTHSYPYDWRTKKPVIIRSSSQWFIDTGSLSEKAEKALVDVVIGAGNTDLSKSLVSMVNHRPSWCISRQRVWGVPIPSITVDGSEENTLISPELVERVADLVDEKNDTDIWWKEDIHNILNHTVLSSLNLSPSTKVMKSFNVMDVWLDSGLAWACSRNNYDDQPDQNRKVDAVLEGVDQFRGWFQSLLLTSCALKDTAPYKRVFVHGFCMDDKGRKMSKSIGNVVDPDTVTDGSLSSSALGADGLRLWVALYGAETSGESKIGPTVLKDVERKMISIRNSLRFIIGAQNGMDIEWRPNEILPIIDQSILRNVIEFSSRIHYLHSLFRFRSIANETIQFINHLSTNYLSLIRDRLYCNPIGSHSHRSAQFTLRMIGHLLTHSISPILPHLSIEYEMNVMGGEPEMVLKRNIPFGKTREENESIILGQSIKLKEDLDEVVHILTKLRGQINEIVGPKDDITLKSIELSLSNESSNIMKSIKDEDIIEMLGVSSISIRLNQSIDSTSIIDQSDKIRCDRCRRIRRDKGMDYCNRCIDALKVREVM